MDAKNTRRDVSLGPNKRIKREKRSAKSIVVMGIMAILVISGVIGVFKWNVKSESMRHTITVDGDPSDWTGTLPNTNNAYLVSNGEYVWNDTAGDERTNFANPDPRVDLTEFRVTGDNSYIYFMAKFSNMSGFYLGDNGATFLAIAIDNGTQGGETYFAGESDTNTSADAAWEYQIVVNLADSRYSGKNMSSTTYPLNESTANWGSIFYVVNNSWKFQNFTGDTGQHGLMAVNLTLNTIEIKIAWGVLGVDLSTLPSLNISVITARGYSDYSSNSGNTWDVSGESDALDCITTTGPNTWDEVQDGVVNDYATITFDSTGDVSGGSFIPEFTGIIVPVILLLAIPVIVKRKL